MRLVDATIALLRQRGADIKIIDSATDPLGYSGVNATIKTQAGIYAEIQVNTPAMIYAKESEAIARSQLGDDIYGAISSSTGIPGSQGHRPCLGSALLPCLGSDLCNSLNLHVDRNIVGPPVLVPDLNRVTAVFQYDNASKIWKTVTIYPVKK